jgi:hypothetical protein
VVPVSPAVDSRADRTVQGTVAVVLLAAFVFGQMWVVPVLGVLVGAGAAFGPAGSPFHRIFGAYISPRLSPATSYEDAATVRVQDVLLSALLGAATLALLISLSALAWVIALVGAGIAAVAATTGVHLGVVVRDGMHRS